MVCWSFRETLRLKWRCEDRYGGLISPSCRLSIEKFASVPWERERERAGYDISSKNHSTQRTLSRLSVCMCLRLWCVRWDVCMWIIVIETKIEIDESKRRRKGREDKGRHRHEKFWDTKKCERHKVCETKKDCEEENVIDTKIVTQNVCETQRLWDTERKSNSAAAGLH